MGSEGAAEHLARFTELLGSWGERINLVGSTDPAALRVHLEDSLAPASYLLPHSRVVDLGTGAGLPGVPLLIARPDLDMTLVEIRERRVHFLRQVIRTLELDCTVLRRRIEEPPSSPYDVALLRAVAAPQEAVPLARPWVSERGSIWLWTTEPPDALLWPSEAVVDLGPRGHVLRFSAAAI